MRLVLFYVFVTLLVTAGLSACGVKGSLKTPTQIEQQKEKDARKAEKKKAKEAKEKAEQAEPVKPVAPENKEE